ncbi:MAG: homocysteine S-methyltransferase family protein [Candidatus Ranarchaeia archaeon]
MKQSILKLVEQRPVIIDGAMRPVFQRLNFPEGHHTGEWSVDYPERVQEIHRAYWDAGSDAVATNTWGANRFQLETFGKGLVAKHDIINRRSVELALEICPLDKYVFGDLGPSGKLLEPYDETPVEAVEEAYADQAGILIDAGVDFLVFETFFNLTEAIAAVRGARESSKSIPIVVMCTFKYNKKRGTWFTSMGQGVQQFFDGVIEAGADIVGENCMPSTDLPIIASLLRASAKTPICVRPNAGVPHIKNGKDEHPISPFDFAQHIMYAKKQGIQMFGGCCGTTPAHIRVLRQQLIC